MYGNAEDIKEIMGHKTICVVDATSRIKVMETMGWSCHCCCNRKLQIDENTQNVLCLTRALALTTSPVHATSNT